MLCNIWSGIVLFRKWTISFSVFLSSFRGEKKIKHSHDECSRQMLLMFILISEKYDLSIISQKCILYILLVLKTLHSEFLCAKSSNGFSNGSRKGNFYMVVKGMTVLFYKGSSIWHHWIILKVNPAFKEGKLSVSFIRMFTPLRLTNWANWKCFPNSWGSSEN